MELIRINCNYLCFFKLKSLTGALVGILLFLPIGLFGGIIAGSTLGGGWVAYFIEMLLGKNTGIIGSSIIMIGVTCGFLIIFIFFIIIGANLGNLVGWGINNIVLKIVDEIVKK